MFLIIVGTGAMGQSVMECAKEDGTFDKIYMVEPLENNWPNQKADAIVDFSNPKAIKGIYDYCQKFNGNIPVIIGTTGQSSEEDYIIELLEKICPVVKKSNFSRGVNALNEIADKCHDLLPSSDIVISETHHTMKKDSPSGTAKTLCDVLNLPYENVLSMRIGTMPGEHVVRFALEDEIIELKHTAFSKKIFAKGAIEVTKLLIKID